jgi:hypothetical protein
MGYARVSPEQAGTVDVQCLADGQATRAEITYDLTALRPAAQAGLQRFAYGYDNFLNHDAEAPADQLSCSSSSRTTRASFLGATSV